jgi:hypothetical protein
MYLSFNDVILYHRLFKAKNDRLKLYTDDIIGAVGLTAFPPNPSAWVLWETDYVID